MNQMCGYLVANLMVAQNLRLAAEREAKDSPWDALIARCEAMGCRLTPPNCCETFALYDKNDDPVGDCSSDEESQDLGMATLFVEQLEKNGGIRP